MSEPPHAPEPARTDGESPGPISETPALRVPATPSPAESALSTAIPAVPEPTRHAPAAIPGDPEPAPHLPLPAPTDREREAARAAVLRQIDSAFADGVPVVNYVRTAMLSTSPEPFPAAPAPYASRHPSPRAQRRAQRRAERQRRDPEARIDFNDWVAIPWQARPLEARLADIAHAIGEGIVRSPAWRHTLLDIQRLRLDPLREAADIAYAAYRLYRQRIALGPRPAGEPNPVLDQAQRLFDAHFAGLNEAWQSLVDRVATLRSYRTHLAELAPILAAQQTVERLTDVRLDQDMTAIYTDAARNELAAADTRDLTDSVDGISGALVAVLGRLDRDVRELSALVSRPLP